MELFSAQSTSLRLASTVADLTLPPSSQSPSSSGLHSFASIGPSSMVDLSEEQVSLVLRGMAVLSRDIRLQVNEQAATPIRNNLLLLTEAVGTNDSRESTRLLGLLATQLSGLRDQDFRPGAPQELRQSIRVNIPRVLRSLAEQAAPPPDV